MFYPVRILDAQGRIRKVVSSKQLSRNHWRDFDKMLAEEFAGKRRKKAARKDPDPLWTDHENLEME